MNNDSASVKIIYADTDFVVAEKPHNMPCAPLYKNEENCALTAVLREFPFAATVQGKKSIESGLVHRLDTGTHGLFVVALSQNAFDSLWSQNKNGTFVKTYTAFVDSPNMPFIIEESVQNEGVDKERAPFEYRFTAEKAVQQEKPESFVFPPFEGKFCENADIESFFRFYGKEGKSVLPVSPREKKEKKTYAAKKAGNVLYKTHIDRITVNGAQKTAHESGTAVKCSLSRGFRHQVRAHLAWAGYPISGDPIYNPNSAHGVLELHATALSFIHPRTGETCLFCLNDF